MDAGLETVVEAARAALGDAEEVIGEAGAALRFELFHAANSICSQKVRVVLAHHRLPYLSHAMNLFAGDTYLPGYVRLRMRGCERFGGALASRHDGNTSASDGGCDGAVVPTLVDRRTGEVVVDSKRICLHLDEQAPEPDRLRPAALADVIDAELAVVDALPNYQMLMGRGQGGADPEALKTAAGAFSRRKVDWCDRYLSEHAGEAALIAAYTAKRSKELSAAEELFSPDAMRDAYQRAERALAVLERRLAHATGGWLLRDTPTMADLFWGVELLRMENVGVAHFWEGGRFSSVERLAGATRALSSIRSAVLDWPGALF